MYTIRDTLEYYGIENLLDLSINQISSGWVSDSKTKREFRIDATPSVYKRVIGVFYENRDYNEDFEVLHNQRLSSIRSILGTNRVIPYFMKREEDIALTAKDTNYVVARFVKELNRADPSISGEEKGVSVAFIGRNRFDIERMKDLYVAVSHIEVSDSPIRGHNYHEVKDVKNN
ncbi:hypothetical protein KY345_06915 [Candidatus Woesearchaeota archaeon]|nr:hypothetical protein [Candidatus Woesearchaeota archaeon]